MSHFEIVRTNAPQPWHARLVASNGRVVMTTENYARRIGAERAVVVAADAFGVRMNTPPTADPSVHPSGRSRLIGMTTLPTDTEISFDVRFVDERQGLKA